MRNRTTYDTVENKFINIINKYLENSLGEKIKLEPLSIKINNNIYISNVSLENLKIKIWTFLLGVFRLV